MAAAAAALASVSNGVSSPHGGAGGLAPRMRVRLRRNLAGREVAVADTEGVTVPHRAEHVQHVGAEDGIDAFQEASLRGVAEGKEDEGRSCEHPGVRT